MSKHLGNVLRADPADGPARRRRAALVHGRQRARPGRPAGSGTAALRGDRPQGPAHVLEHRVVLRPVRERRGLGARHRTGARRRPTGRCWTGGRSPSCTATVREVDTALEGFDTAPPGRRLAEFIDDLSNWYVRRSRRRFWEGRPRAAFATLYECLETLTRLMAPIAPFLTDYVWDVLRPPDGPDSVHLAAGRGRTRPGGPGADRPDGARPPAGGAGPLRACRARRADPPAARPRPGRRAPAGPRCRTSCAAQIAEELNVRGSRSWPRSAATWSSTRSSRTSASWASASASGTPKVAKAITSADAGGARPGAARRGRRGGGRGLAR